MPRPLVLFLDTGRWSAFDQFSAAVRRRGCRTIRVTTERGRMSDLLGRLCYSKLIHLESMAQLAELATRTDLTRVVDMHCTEWVHPELMRALPNLPLPSDVAEAVSWRIAYSDKYAVSERLRAGGIAVPETMPGTSELDDVVARLGLPIVVKGRIGAGGGRVRVVHAASDLPTALAMCGGADDCYFEAFAPGENLRYSSCRLRGDTTEEIVYATHRPADSLGPARGVEVLNDETMREAGRGTLRLLGGSGYANIEAMRTSDGRTLVIDVNLRIWHSLVTLCAAGYDFIGAYPRVSAGGAALTAASVVPGDGLILVFPDDALDAATSLPIPTAVGTLLRGFRQYRRVLGPRYLLGVAAMFCRALLRDRA